MPEEIFSEIATGESTQQTEKDRSYKRTRPDDKRVTFQIMIASTYLISLILWPPWIISWPYIEGKFTVGRLGRELVDECDWRRTLRCPRTSAWCSSSRPTQ